MRLPLMAVLFALVSVSAYAKPFTVESITIDTFNQPQSLAISTEHPFDTSTLTGLEDVLGGSRTMTLSYMQPQSPFPVSAGAGRTDGIGRFSLLMEWDANGEGLDLDLRKYDGFSLLRGDSDGGNPLILRLLSSDENYFEFRTDTSAYDAPEIDPTMCCGHPGATPTYTFDRFTAIGDPKWKHIEAIQVELQGGGSPGAFVDNLRIVTPEKHNLRIVTPEKDNLPIVTPEPGTGLLLSVGLLAAFRRRTKMRSHQDPRVSGQVAHLTGPDATRP